MALYEVSKYYIQMHVSTYYYFIIPIIYLYIYKKYKPPKPLFVSAPMALYL